MKSAIENIYKGWKIKTSFLVLFFLMLFSGFYSFYLSYQTNKIHKLIQQVHAELYDFKKELIRENNTQSKVVLNNKPAAFHFANNAAGFFYNWTHVTTTSKNFHEFKSFDPQLFISTASLLPLSKTAIDKLKKRMVKMPVTVFLFIEPEKCNINWRPL